MSTQQIRLGLPPEEIVERNAGSLEHRAMALAELDSALYAIGEEIRYDDEELAKALTVACDTLRERLARTYLDADGHLTDTRRCRACDGNGSYNHRAGESVVCDECNGDGVERAA